MIPGIDSTLHPGDPQRRELVVIGHGVTANKDRPWLVALAERLARAGVPALRISFSGNGASAGRFEDSNITREVEDLGRVLDALEDREVTYVGHSMGAAVGVIRAGRDPRIRRLVSLAGMVHTRAFVRRKFGHLTPGRDCMWDKPECPLSQAFVDDLEAIDSVAELGARVRVPWLLVHGTEDDVVPLQDSLDILAHAPPTAELIRLEGADHVFSGPATERMTRAVTTWLAPGAPA